MQTPCVYLKAEQHNIVHQRRASLADIGEWECADRKLLARITALSLHHFQEKKQKSQMEFFSVLHVIELIHKKFPEVEVVSLGDEDFIVEYLAEESARWKDNLKLALLCVLIFFGSAFTIMAFNNDINIEGVFDRFYTQVTGVSKPMVSQLEIAYSLGIAVGILVFFNHLGKRKFSSDPTPIQVEIYKFRRDMDDTLIENAEKEGHKEDVS